MSINKTTFGRSKKKIGWEEVASIKTGEVSTNIKFRITDLDINWERVWLENLLFAIGLVGDKSVEVLMFFIENRDYENKVLATQETIVRQTGISRKTIYKVVKKLIESDVVRKLELGFQVNPHIIFNALAAKKKGITRLDVVMSYYNYEKKKKDVFTFESTE